MKRKATRHRGRFRWLLSALLGLAAGIGLPRVVRYLNHLLGQPRLLQVSTPGAQGAARGVEAQAFEIAARDLRGGLEVRTLENGATRTILCAGVRNFREPWARDTGFAVFGLLELGAFEEARQALEVFLLTQHESGQFPVKIHSTNILDRFVHSMLKRQQPVDHPLRPKYITAHNTISLDGNSLLIIACLKYTASSGDEDFIRDNWTKLKSALRWLEGYREDGGPLLQQGAFADWADTISRTGKVLYTNVIYWKALVEMSVIAGRFGFEQEEEAFRESALLVSEAIETEFWRPDLGYFVTSRVFDNLSSSGNLLAIAWGLAGEEQARSILDAMRFYGMAIPVPTKAVHRAYPRQFIAIENRIGGIADYHTYFAWLWLGAWHVIALARLGRLEEAGELVYNMSRVIVRDSAVHEVYAPNGAYASTLWYTSESPLTWSAGMFVYAFREYQRALRAAPGPEGLQSSG